MSTYETPFFEDQSLRSNRSAERVVPLILDLLRPNSVIDVGCGVGAWLNVFMKQGVSDALGIDGDWVPRDLLRVPKDNFMAADLAKPPQLGRTYDLAVSLEVGEHLPPTSADAFVSVLTTLAPVVVFSAAIPGQGGTGHLNEQWPSYWAERFAGHGYTAINCLRPVLWTDPNVEWWYAQNAVIYATREAIEKNPRLMRAAAEAPPLVPMVHPALFELALTRGQTLRDVIRIAPRALSRAVSLRVKRLTGNWSRG